MQSCPVCNAENPDTARSCSRCNSDFGVLRDAAVDDADEQRTMVVPASPSTIAPGAAASAARPAPVPTPGDRIGGRYEIIQRLGQGGMGMVFKARDRELDRIIALKTIHPILASNPAVLRRFKQEILLARQITHRNVIRIYDLGVAGDLRFITMEYVEGEDLKKRLRLRGRLAPDEAAALMKQICEGLQAAHAEDVIHRDLKPENVLIDTHGQVRIMDFGLARNEDASITATGAILGTADYMSPEQARGERADVRSDIFSAGILFYEMLTGELPFAADSAVAAMLKRTRERAPRVDSIDPSTPRWLTDIVGRCLEPDPAARYQTVADILQDLDNREPRRTIAPGTATARGVLPAGSMLGARYRIEELAGEGGMGRVYRATDLDLHRSVALKVVRPELAEDSDSLEKLKQEILLASRISHRHVLRIHDLGEADGLRFISMAWVDGEDLEQLISRSAGPLPEDRIIALARHLCEGLEAAHREGIVHRDLKPRNVLLDSAGNACISDFGLAQASGGGAGEVAGTPRYMSPEQAEGKPVDARTDIYSLGLVLYEAATGEVPFTGDSALQVMVRRLVATPKNPRLLNPALSEHTAAVIMRCLERDRDLRYPSARALLDDLEPAPAPGTPRPRVNRRWIYAAAAVLVAIAASLGLWRVLRGPARLEGRYIAVLPFRALQPDASLSLAAEGISDAIATRLFSLCCVHVTAAPEKADLNQPITDIARRLGANLLINGTVQSVGGRLSVTVHLVDPQTRRWIWGHDFSGSTDDLLNIQEQICAQLIAALNVHPSEREERAGAKPTDDAAAYDLYLEGRKVLKDRHDAQGATEALNFFEQASSKDPSFTLAWTGITDASLQLYRIKKDSIWSDKALAAAQQAHGLNPGLAEAHLAMGSAYTATGRNDQAIAELKDALKLAPNSDDAYVRLGRAYMAIGRANDALDAFRHAVKANPYYWSNHYQLGVACLRLGRNKEALAEFQKVTELNPGHASAYNNIGAIYERESRFDESIRMFQKAIQLQPYAGPYSNLGTEYFFLGRYQDAIPMFEKAVELSPNDEVAAGNLADAYRQAGEKEKARATYERAIRLAYKELEVNPQNAGALGSLARYYAQNGDPAKGAEFIARARAINSADNELMYNEAVVDALGGRTQQALNVLEDALANGYSLEEARRDPDLKSVRALPGFETAARRATAKAGETHE